MSKIVAPEFGDDSQIDRLLEQLIALLAVRCDQKYLDEVAEAVRRPLVSERPEGFYTPKELADLVDKKPFTTREWCRNRRINAQKIDARAGGERLWRIPHSELERYRAAGLLPDERRKRRRDNPNSRD